MASNSTSNPGDNGPEDAEKGEDSCEAADAVTASLNAAERERQTSDAFDSSKTSTKTNVELESESPASADNAALSQLQSEASEKEANQDTDNTAIMTQAEVPLPESETQSVPQETLASGSAIESEQPTNNVDEPAVTEAENSADTSTATPEPVGLESPAPSSDIAINSCEMSEDNRTVTDISASESQNKDITEDTEEKKETEGERSATASSSSAVEGAACAMSVSDGEQAQAASGTEQSPLQSVYHIKWISFNDSMFPIVTQNENGPCPLLAIVNMLVLQGKIKMPPMIEIVTSGQLMEYLADCIFEHAPKDITEDARLNYEQNMHDAMAVFHKLQTGLDVNVKFTSVSTFEYTPECIVFDLLSIPLYHGWLVDPDSPTEVTAIGNCGYNQLVEKIITQKNSSREELVTEALIAEEFINRTASQLTYHGLSELSSTVKEEQLCVFFRNNHFSTLYKRKNELFILVTDQGFLTESNVVWETLCNVEGDGHFVDANFRTYRKSEPSPHTIAPSTIPVGSPQQVDQDYLVALSLQEEQGACEPQVNIDPAPMSTDSDHALAMRLQEEENRQANRRQQQLANQQHLSQQHQQRVAQEKKKDKSDCVIL